MFVRDSYGILKDKASDFRFELVGPGNLLKPLDSLRIQASVLADQNTDGSFTVIYLATVAGFYSIKGSLMQAGGLSATFYNSRSFRMMPSFDLSGKVSAPLSPTVCKLINWNRTLMPSLDNCISPQMMGGSVLSAKFAGFVMPLFSETYTMSLISPDYVTVYVEGLKVIDKVTNASRNKLQFDGTIALQAMTMYSLLVEYFLDAGNNVSVILKWKSASQALETISSNRM